jgi:hypothetical protein
LKAFLTEGSPTFLKATASAEKGGYKAQCNHSFQQIGYRNRKRFESKISTWLDDHGYSETDLKIKLCRLLEARETVFQRVKGMVDQATLPEGHRVAAITGEESLLEIEVENYAVQVTNGDGGENSLRRGDARRRDLMAGRVATEKVIFEGEA